MRELMYENRAVTKEDLDALRTMFEDVHGELTHLTATDDDVLGYYVAVSPLYDVLARIEGGEVSVNDMLSLARSIRIRGSLFANNGPSISETLQDVVYAAPEQMPLFAADREPEGIWQLTDPCQDMAIRMATLSSYGHPSPATDIPDYAIVAMWRLERGL